MEISHIEHLGIAVKSLDEAIPYWENVLGLKCYAIEEVRRPEGAHGLLQTGPDQDRTARTDVGGFDDRQGSSRTAASASTTWHSPVKNIEEQLADAEAKGIRLIDKTPRKGAEGMTIAFLHPKSTQGILTELCEDKNN